MKIYAVTYHNYGGYHIEIDAVAPIEFIIKTVRVTAASRKDALKTGIQRLHDEGHINRTTASFYLARNSL